MNMHIFSLTGSFISATQFLQVLTQLKPTWHHVCEIFAFEL